MLESGWNEKKKKHLLKTGVYKPEEKESRSIRKTRGFSLRRPGGWANNRPNKHIKNKLQHQNSGWTRGVWRAGSTPGWGQGAGCCKSDPELGRRRSELEACKERKQQKDPLHVANTKEKAGCNKEQGFCNSAHCEKKRPRSSWDPEAEITFSKGSPEENQDCQAVSTSLQTSLLIIYADMFSGVLSVLKSSPNGVPLKNSQRLCLIWQFLHWPSHFLQPTFKTIVTFYSFDRPVSHKNLLTEGTKKSDASSKTTLFKLFSQLTLICFSLLIPPATTTTPFVFVLFEAISFKHVRE